MEDLFEVNNNDTNLYNDFNGLINIDHKECESSDEENLFSNINVNNSILSYKKEKYLKIIKQICNRNDLKYFNYYINNFEKIQNIKGIKVKGENKICVLVLCLNFIYCNLNNEIMTLHELKYQLKENISKKKIYCKHLAKIIFNICNRLDIKNFINCDLLPFMEKYITNMVRRIKNFNNTNKKSSKIQKRVNIFDDIFDLINNCSDDNSLKSENKSSNEDYYGEVKEEKELKYANSLNNKIKKNIRADMSNDESNSKKKYRASTIPENENVCINEEVNEEIEIKENFLYNYSSLHIEDIKDVHKLSKFNNCKFESLYKNSSDYFKDKKNDINEISNNYYYDSNEYSILDCKNFTNSNHDEYYSEENNNIKYENENILLTKVPKKYNVESKKEKQNNEKKIIEYLEKNITLLSLYSCILYSFYILWNRQENLDMNVHNNKNRCYGGNLHYLLCSCVIITFNVFNIKIKDHFICYCLNVTQHAIISKKKKILNFFLNTINEFLGIDISSYKKIFLYIRVIFSNYILIQMYLFYIIKKYKLMNKNNFLFSLKQLQIYLAKLFSIIQKKFLNLSDIIVDYNFLFRSECVYKKIQQIVSQNQDFIYLKRQIKDLIKNYLTEEEKKKFYEYNFNESYDIDLSNINSYLNKLVSYGLLNSEDANVDDSHQTHKVSDNLKIKNIHYDKTSNIRNININGKKALNLSLHRNVSRNISYNNNYISINKPVNNYNNNDTNRCNDSTNSNIDNNSFSCNANNSINNDCNLTNNDYNNNRDNNDETTTTTTTTTNNNNNSNNNDYNNNTNYNNKNNNTRNNNDNDANSNNNINIFNYERIRIINYGSITANGYNQSHKIHSNNAYNNILDSKNLNCYNKLNKNSNMKPLVNKLNFVNNIDLENCLKDMKNLGNYNFSNFLEEYDTIKDGDISLDFFNHIDILKKINLSTINDKNIEIICYYNIKIIVQFLFFTILKSVIYNCYSLSFFSLSNLHHFISCRKNSKNILWECNEEIENINIFLKKKLTRKLKETKNKKYSLEKYFFCEQIYYIENFQNSKLYKENFEEFLKDKKIILKNITELIKNDDANDVNKINCVGDSNIHFISNSNENNYFTYSNNNNNNNNEYNYNFMKEGNIQTKDLIENRNNQKKGKNKKKIKTIIYHYDVLHENFNEYSYLKKESFNFFDNIYNIKMMKEYKDLEIEILKNNFNKFLFGMFNNMNYSFGSKKKKLIKMNNCLYHTYHLIGIKKLSNIGYIFTFKNELNDNYSKVLKTKFSNILSLEDVNFLFNRFFYFLFSYIKKFCCFSNKNGKESDLDRKSLNTVDICLCNKIKCCYKIKTIVVFGNF
ncbi:conserved Plasmodium protein, unknown function [Plasmodium relictum]|uniref:Uncharacterized protein n=1 Tax=Plasmodium relictum TaxID=85471 RepID=A0A1J1H4M1_PLARL|nr:conserved Plasmodium protein, unknown function [Plasmodium relictum]CRG99698.1 conserved Plasmodium protein, unknown function [Plasmodium relictum]